jgi:hypothetical protein
MSLTRLALPLTLAAVAFGGVALVVDALIVTDEERLETFVDDVTGEEGRVAHALDYTDPSRVPVELVTNDALDVYGDGEEVDLADGAHVVLAPIASRDATLVQETIEIRGDNALVALRLRTGDGPVDAQFRLVRRGDGWLVSRVRVL